MTTSMILLAAGQGTRLRPLTDDRPKCLVELRGRALLEWQLDAARELGLEPLIVGGYRADQLEGRGATVIRNPLFATTNMVASLFCAEARFGDRLIVSYGDIVYEPGVLGELLAATDPATVVIDRDWRSYWDQRTDDVLGDAESLRLDDRGRIRELGRKVADIERIEGQYIGLFALAGEALAAARALYARLAQGVDPSTLPGGRPLAMMYMTDFLQRLIDDGLDVQALPIAGRWLEVDSLSDLELAERCATAVDGHLAIDRSGSAGSSR